ncbi:probable glutathione peroxidase 5 isoform X1 [Rutidosis leptorrhynchoides]|uniref:probable glutathione peroxidase 5 isoform X1 n=1 Tax=Rutidosis leptorrhynchoides TaxID=125765 RepID=UPI003A99898F
MGAASSVPENSIHEFTVKDSKGKDVDLSMYKGKVVLIVNVASKCGFTNSNYPQMTQLYESYRAKVSFDSNLKGVNDDGIGKITGLEILAFPCNQFLNQEPESSEKVEEFACSRFNAEYPIFQKVRVNGPKAAPLYKFLKAKKGGFCGSRIKWNFTKFLVDKEGHVIRRYGPSTSPLSIEKDIQKALNAGM